MNIPVLMYHEIVDDITSALKFIDTPQSYFVPVDAFHAHLQLISKLGLLTIHLDNLLIDENNNINNSKKIVISFDDGYIGNYLYAFPALKAQGMVATFFCAVSLIGKENMMTWPQLRELASGNMSIQSHGFSHKPLASLSKKEVYEEFVRSKKELEDNLGEKVSYISLPHGSFNQSVINIATEVGYNKICTSLIGYNKGHELCINRIMVSPQYDLQKYEEIISGKSNFAMLNLSKSIKLLIKNIVGHQNYLNIFHFYHRIKKSLIRKC